MLYFIYIFLFITFYYLYSSFYYLYSSIVLFNLGIVVSLLVSEHCRCCVPVYRFIVKNVRSLYYISKCHDDILAFMLLSRMVRSQLPGVISVAAAVNREGCSGSANKYGWRKATTSKLVYIIRVLDRSFLRAYLWNLI